MSITKLGSVKVHGPGVGRLAVGLGLLVVGFGVAVFAVPAVIATAAPLGKPIAASGSTILVDAGRPLLDAAHDVLRRPVEALDAWPDAVRRPPEVHPIAPDPVPLTSSNVYVLGVRFERGNVRLERVRREPRQAGPTTRTFGRFAAELYVGPTLLDRVRFDFPLIHDDTAVSEAFERGLSIAVDVRVADSDRPNRLEIWDRATDRRWTYRYPLALTK